MTTPPRASRFTGAFGAVQEKGTEGYARAMGRAFVMAFAGAMRNLRTYPADNPVVQKSVEELVAMGGEYVRDDGELDFRLAGEFLFINGVRLRLDVETWHTFDFVRTTFRASGTGQLRMERDATAAQWTTLLKFFLAPEGRGPAECHVRLQTRIAEAGVDLFEVSPPVQSEDEDSGSGSAERGEKGGEGSVGAYAQGVAVLRDAMRALSTGEGLNVKRMKRMVQLIVDRVMTDEPRMLGLTTVRGYADYEVMRAVHVCILAVALGRRLGLTRLHMYDLGLAALFHDIGMGRAASHVPEHPGPLSEEEWTAVRAHPWMGVLVLFQMREAQEFPYRSMLVSYQHHLRDNGGGYPRPTNIARATFFSRIVAVADSYDAAVTTREYRPQVQSPAEVLSEMRRNAAGGYDPVVLKAFTGMLGRWPVGTVVVLDSMEIGIVWAASVAPEHHSRPTVRIIANEEREVQFPGILVDLGEKNEQGRYRRTILATVDPARYGINVGDYFIGEG